MNIKSIKYESQNILSGKSGSSYDAIIQAITRHLRTGQRTSPVAEKKHQNKAKEKEQLINFAKDNNLFLDTIFQENFISEGAEQKVYIKDDRRVFKLNDAIYYASWEDYFHNLLLHNYFFADTAYHFLGFYMLDNDLFAVVGQNFIKADCLTNLNQVKVFLKANGFINTKNHDYFQPELGLILEGLHEENVLTNKGILYFIDTVFYVKPEIFWNQN